MYLYQDKTLGREGGGASLPYNGKGVNVNGIRDCGRSEGELEIVAGVKEN